MATNNSRKLAPKKWEPFFRRADVRVEDLDASKSNKGKIIRMGRFLSPNVNREVPIDVNGRTGKAVLRVEEGRSKEKRYFFEVTWDDETPAAPALPKKSRTKKERTKASLRNKKTKSHEPTTVKSKAQGKSDQVANQRGGNSEDW